MTRRTTFKAMVSDGFDGRVRFNWGYWDALFDAAHRTPRQLVDGGKQTLTTVSATFDRPYHAGYRAGLDPIASATSSEPAWLSLDEDARADLAASRRR